MEKLSQAFLLNNWKIRPLSRCNSPQSDNDVTEIVLDNSRSDIVLFRSSLEGITKSAPSLSDARRVLGLCLNGKTEMAIHFVWLG